jgi:hypothetical protein
MKLKLKIVNDEIKNIFDDSKEFIFKVDHQVNLDDYIEFISNIEENVDISPESYDEFKKSYKNISDKNLILVKYLYDIILTYNDCFDKYIKSE